MVPRTRTAFGNIVQLTGGLRNRKRCQHHPRQSRQDGRDRVGARNNRGEAQILSHLAASLGRLGNQHAAGTFMPCNKSGEDSNGPGAEDHNSLAATEPRTETAWTATARGSANRLPSGTAELMGISVRWQGNVLREGTRDIDPIKFEAAANVHVALAAGMAIAAVDQGFHDDPVPVAGPPRAAVPHAGDFMAHHHGSFSARVVP